MEIKTTGQHCPLCGSEGVAWTDKNGIQLRKCCGNLLAWSWPSIKHYEDMYKSMDYHENACKELGLPSQIDRFEEHRKADICRINWLKSRLDWETTRVLDVGASNGAFVYASTYDIPCKQVIGLEPNLGVCQWADRNYGIPIHYGTWEDMEGSWNLIVGNDIIEHLTNPEGFLRRAAKHAEYIYLETPEWRDEYDVNWKHIKPKEHICLFGEESMRALVAKSGLKVKEIHRPIPYKMGVLITY